MRCSECNFENKPEAKFCNSCGTTLVIPATSTGGGLRCPECDFENEPESKFCNSCGAKLVAETTFCTDCGTKIPSGQQLCAQCSGRIAARPDVPQPKEPQLSAAAPKPKSHKLKWGAIALVVLMVVAGGAVAGVVLTSDSSGNKFEEASQIYGLDADCPAQIGYLEKISETPLTDGLEEMGAIRGRILEYEDGSDHVLVMAYTFASQNSARQAFDQLEGDWLDTDFYMMDSDAYGGYFCRLIEDVIYLASGTIDNVVTVTDGIASANCL